MSIPVLPGPVFEGTRDQTAAFLRRSAQAQYYTYLLCHPNGIPFYVGKGMGRRVLEHELQAQRNLGAHETNPLKSNVIRKILRHSQDILYRIDLKFAADREADCLAREAVLIRRYKRLHEGGVLTNLAGAVDGPLTAAPPPKKRSKATLPGDAVQDPEQAVLNQYLKGFGPVDSSCVQPLSRVRDFAPITPHSSPRKPSQRMCYALMASAVAHGLDMTDGTVIPRNFVYYPNPDHWPTGYPVPDAVTGHIGRNVSRDILNAGLAELAPTRSASDDAFRLGRAHVASMIDVVGRKALEQRGLI